MQPVRLVLLLLTGPREGENDFVEFSSVDDAVAYAIEMQDQPEFQLEGIEDVNGKTLVCFDYLSDRCRMSRPEPQRRFG